MNLLNNSNKKWWVLAGVSIASFLGCIDFTIVKKLSGNDILFVDSSHVSKTGSDLNFILFDLLPVLQPGVIIHFHDMFNNFEYPKGWVLEKNHSWNELYAVQAFLSFNDKFQIEYFNDYVAKEHPSELRKLSPLIASRIFRNPGGGLWVRRT